MSAVRLSEPVTKTDVEYFSFVVSQCLLLIYGSECVGAVQVAIHDSRIPPRQVSLNLGEEPCGSNPQFTKPSAEISAGRLVILLMALMAHNAPHQTPQHLVWHWRQARQ